MAFNNIILPVRYFNTIFYIMSLKNYARYVYGFIIGMCLEYIIIIEVLIYPTIIIIGLSTIIIVDLVSEHRANTQYDRYYKARNEMLNKRHTPSKD